MAARSRAKASSSSRTERAAGAARGVQKAINDLVGALPLGGLASRLTSVERAVSRLEREVRRAADLAARAGSSRTASPAAKKRTTAKRAGAAAKPTKAATTRRASTRKAAGAGRAAATAPKSAAAKKQAPRKSAGTATRSRRRAAAPSAPATPPVAPEFPMASTPPSLFGDAESASQELGTLSSPEGPGPLPVS
jgi:hypothetical protein